MKINVDQLVSQNKNGADSEETLILLGSNQGNRLEFINQAIQYINHAVGLVIQASSVYETGAWGVQQQPAFLNQVIEVEHAHTPMTLLTELLRIENKMGRLRTEKWGPRIIDLDILYVGQTILQETNLTIPHPALTYRRFTLIPLVECWESFRHPMLHKTNAELLHDCTDTLPVQLFNTLL